MKRLAKDIMNPQVITVTTTMRLREVATLLVEEGITGAPVVDELDHLVGVISQHDVIAHELAEKQEVSAGPPFYQRPFEHAFEDRRGLPLEEFQHDTVEDAMTSLLITVDEATLIPAVAARMVESGIHRLLVVDAYQQLQGIITSLDVLRWVAEEVRVQAEPVE